MQGGRLLRETETEALVGALQQPPASQPATQPATLSAVLLGVTLPPPSRAKNDRDEPSKNTETGGFKSAGFEPAAGGGGGGVTPPLASMDTPGSVTLNEKKEEKEKNSDAEVMEDIYIYIYYYNIIAYMYSNIEASARRYFFPFSLFYVL